MAEVRYTDTTNAKKRKGFWSKLFGRSSNAAEKKDEGGFMNSLANHARQGVIHVAEDEAKKQVEAQLHNSGSQPTDTTTTAANVAPDPSTVVTTTTTPSDALSAPTNWAKRMADTAQQKMQGLQSLGS